MNSEDLESMLTFIELYNSALSQDVRDLAAIALKIHYGYDVD